MKLSSKYMVGAEMRVTVEMEVTVLMDEIPSDWYDYDPEWGTISLTQEGKDGMAEEAISSVTSHYNYDIVDTDVLSWRDGDFIIVDDNGDEVDITEVEPF